MFGHAATAVERILIIGPSWVGDMVMAQSLFKTLKTLHRNADIDVMAPEWSHHVLARMPEVTSALISPFGHGQLNLLFRFQLGRTLKARGYSHCYILPNSLKSALVPAAAGIPHRIGWRGEMRYGLLTDIRLLDKKRYPLMVQRFCALAYPADHSVPDCPPPQLLVDEAERQTTMTGFELSLERPVTVLCPGAEFGPSKQWPAEHFAEVADRQIAAGGQIWIMGSANDRPIAETIANACQSTHRNHVHVLAGRTTLGECIDLMSVADAVVTNDSGLMHIAAALNRPLAAVYGSTSPEFTPPLSERAAVLKVPIACAPCFQRECPLRHHKCMTELKPTQVFAALEELPHE